MTTTDTTTPTGCPFTATAEHSAQAAYLLALAFATAHCSNDVYASLRTTRRLFGTDAACYLHGSIWCGYSWDASTMAATTAADYMLDVNLPMVRDLARAYLQAHDGVPEGVEVKR